MTRGRLVATFKGSQRECVTRGDELAASERVLALEETHPIFLVGPWREFEIEGRLVARFNRSTNWMVFFYHEESVERERER